MVVKILSLYSADVKVTLWSDHLALKRFLQKTTLKAKVNNSGVKLSGYNIKSKFIKGTKNILADTLLVLLTLSKLKKDMNMDMLYLYNCQTDKYWYHGRCKYKKWS